MAPEVEKILQRAIDAIENALRGEIDISELSAQSGYSLTHFCRLFEAAAGMSIGRYITKRRLVHALYAVSCGMDTTGAALEFGFDTRAGFYKAFRREFGCAPTSYLRAHRAARPRPVLLREEIRMTDRKQISRALKAWGMENEAIADIYYANTGYRSDSAFYVGGEYVIKCARGLGLMRRQAELTGAMHRHGVGAQIVPATDGREIVREGETDFMLMRRMEGSPADAPAILRDPALARPIGEGLARLHEALRECDGALCEEEDLLKTLREWAIPAVARQMDLPKGWAERFYARFAALYPSLPRQIVHRDPNPDNMLLNDGKVTAFLDFDLSRILPRIFDPAYATTGVLCDSFSCVGPEERLRYFEMARELWQGYHAVSALSDAEWEALPMMVEAIELICIAAFSGSEKFRPMLEEKRAHVPFDP